jgi:hypothetical protein
MKIIDDIRRERKADWLLAKQMQAEQLRKASEANKDKFLKNFYDPDTPPEQKMTSRDVRDIPDGQVTPETRKHMFEMIQHAAERGPVDPAVSKRNTLDLIIGVRNGSINDMKDIDQSLANHDIDYNGFKLVEGEFLGRKTPEGQRLADLRARFMATYGNSVNPQNASGIKLAEGNKREYDLYSYIRRKEESVPPSQREDLYEPTSPNFIGKTPYARPMSPWEQSKLLDERTANSRKKPQAVEVPPPPREYPDATWDENARN